jgi:hypothetical protein
VLIVGRMADKEELWKIFNNTFFIEPRHCAGNSLQNWEREWNRSVYPMYQPAPSEYKSTTLQQYKLFRLAVLSLRDLTLCSV